MPLTRAPAVGYDALLEPLRIGTTELRNRVVMSAVNTHMASAAGEVTDRLMRFYEERARNGVGLIIIENTCILWPEGKAGKKPTRIDDDRFIPALHELTEVVHAHGAKVGTNLQHTGRQTSVLNSTQGTELVSASAVPTPQTGGDMPRALSGEEVERYVEVYAQSVRRTRDAGFDVAELHGAHGYLLMQFISPFTNRRDDEWGGSFENRMRFPVRVVERARELVGSDFTITWRMSADEGVEGGYGIDDAVEIARTLERAGIDGFSVAAGIYESMTRIFPPSSHRRAPNVELARAVKASVSVPVIVAGKMDDPADAAGAIESGAADAVAMARALLADPSWVRRVERGEMRRIRPCIYHNEGCLGDIFRGWSLQCDVNPDVNRDGPRRFPPTQRPQQVLVVGGGPAGCEAARTAALRGHRVRLVEAGDRLGGALLVAGAPSFRRDLLRLADYYEAELESCGVAIELGTGVDADRIERAHADVVVIATGRRWTAGNELTAYDVLAGRLPDADVVCVVGADQVACLAAWQLAEAGREVTLATEGASVGSDVGYMGGLELSEGLERSGVVVTDAPPDGVQIVWSPTAQPDRSLVDALETGCTATVAAGDCAGGTRVLHAVRDGLRVGMELP